METPILDLKSIVATWLSSSSASWVIGTILRILYGLGLFLLFFPCPKRNLPSQLTYKRRNVRKRQVEPRGRSSRSRKKRGALKAYRAGRKDLAEVGGLMSLSQSSPGRLSCKGCFHRLSSQDSPGEACKAASAGVRQPCGKPVEGAPLTTTPALSLALLTQRTLPLASTLAAEPPSALTRTPLGPVAMSSAPAHSCWPFPNPGHGRMSCHIEFLSRWNTIKVWFFPVSSHFESQQGHLSCHRPVTSFWGGPTNREGETDSPSLANPDVQKLLETEITDRIQTEVWEKEQDDPGTPQMLEAHGIMSGLNFRWGLPLLSLGPADLKACEAQPSALPRSPLPPAATCDSGAPSKADFAPFMGKPLEPPPGDKVLTLTTKASVPSLARPLPAPSPVCEEDQKALGGTLPGEGSGPSEASLLGQEGRPPSPTFPFSLSERKGQSGTFVGAEQGVES
ncbi:spermatogenesis-associated protein 31E1-like [Equus caballus]|uniref:spermatogenesis-associated protein 31E1-like n=1 Tax=Equus caballus TaxID=9796 RepID=UPI0038B2D67A